MVNADTTTKLYSAIHSQPDAVRELLTDWKSPELAAEKLARSGRILLAGIGTSFHAAIVGEYLFRLAGIEAWALRSFEFVSYPRSLHIDDGMIIISHRGSKLQSTLALQRAIDAHVSIVGITGKNSQMQGADIIVTTVEQDPSPAHSISYIGALTRLAQIAARVATLLGRHENAQRLEHGLSLLPTLMENILAREEEIRAVAQEAAAHQRRIYYVGAGPNAPTAPEGALKAKEAAYVTAEGFELEQAIHGPMTAFEAEDLIVPVSVVGPAQPRLADFLLAQSEIGSHVFLLGEAPSVETAALFQRPGWMQFALGNRTDLLEELTPLLAVIPVQLMANFLAAARSINPDSFRLDQEDYKRASTRFRL